MRFFSRFSIRYTVPTVLATMAVLLTVASGLYTWLVEARKLNELTGLRAAAIGNMIVPRIEHSLPLGGDDVMRDFAGLPAVPGLVLALLCDERDQIIQSTRPDWVNWPLASTSAADAKELLARARATQSVQLRESPDRSRLRAAFPFAMPPLPGELRSPRSGVFYSETDLAGPRRALLADAVGRAVVMAAIAGILCTLMVLYLNSRYFQRVGILLGRAGAIGRGESPPAAVLAGGDELAQIDVAVDRMARGLAARDALVRESESRYRSLARNFPNGAILLYDPELRYTLAEGTELAALGLRREDFEGKLVGSVLPGTAEIDSLARSALAGRGGMTVLTIKGRHYQIDVSPVRDAAGVVVAGMVVAQNVTERKKNEEQLRASEARFSGLVQNLDGIIWKAEPPFVRFSFVSQQAERILGYPLGRWLGEPNFWADHIFPEDRAPAMQFRLECGRERKSGSFAYRLIRADGGTIWVRDFVAVEAKDGDSIRLVGVMLDITRTRQTELELTERELHYRTLFDSSPDAIYVVVADGDDLGRIVDVNDTAVRTLGWTRAELLAMSIDQVALPTAGTMVKDRLGLIVRGHVRQFSGRHVRKDRSGLPVEVTARSCVVNGRICVLAFARDLTQHLLQTAEVRESRNRLRTTFDALVEGIVVQDSTGRILENNAASERILGLSRDQLVGLTSVDSRWCAIHPDGKPFPGETHPAMVSLRTGRAQRGVVMGVHKPDGGLTWIEINTEVILEPDGRVTGVVASFSDITERRNAAIQVKQSELQLESVINSVTDAIITVDEDGLIVVFNRSAEKMFGFSKDEILGQDLSRLLPERFRIVHAEHVRRFAMGAAMSRDMGELRKISALRRNGEEFPIEASISRIELEGRKLFTVILRDVTQRQEERRRRHELEQQLQQSQKLESLGTLAGAITHDFNNLLTGILGHIDLAQTVPGVDQSTREMLEPARRGALMARDLVKRLLLFARRRSEGPFAPVDLTALMRDTLPLLTAAASAAIKVQANLPAEPLFVFGDASQLQQMVMNLVVNAVHAIEPGGGDIAVSLEELPAAALASDEPVERYVRLAVRDTGVGMDGETRRRLFEPFFTTKQPGQGTGLGLAIVHGVVFAHGGRIHVESEVGCGTTFFVTLPLVTVEDGDRAAEPSREAGARVLAGLRVLVVDDEVVVATLLKTALTGFGAVVTMFTSAVQAREAFSAECSSFDAAVVDLSMPEITGLELSREFRLLRPDLPLVLVSGDMYRHDLGSLANEGRTILVHKPFEIELLHAEMQRLRVLISPGLGNPTVRS